MSALKYFEAYSNLGLKTIPLYPFAKKPMMKEWQKEWDSDKIMRIFRAEPKANIGILLGKIIDVEADDPKANKLLDRLIGDYTHPQYKSKRSTHHLFLTPNKDLQWKKFNGIEFRGKLHQSVLPPSKRLAGVNYVWIDNSNLHEIPEMPSQLMEFYTKNIEGQTLKIKKGHILVWCTHCNKEKPINEKRYFLEKQVFESKGLSWQCKCCRRFDIRKAARKFKNQHRNQSSKRLRL